MKGGRSSSKSWGVVAALVGYACTYRMFIVCGREIQKSIKESAQKLFVDTIRRHGLESEFRILETEIEHKFTGTRIIFLGLKTNPEALKGLEGVSIIWIEEADRVSEDSWDLIIPTIVRNHNSQLWATWNPQLPSDRVETLFDPTRNPDAVCVHLNYLENPFCSEELIKEAEKMKAEDPEKYNWIYLGQYRPEGSSTLISLVSVMNAIGRPPPITDPNTLIVGGLDLGFYQDRTVLTVRHGHNLLFTKIWNHPETTALISELTALMNRWKIAKLGIDSLGPGAPIIDLMRAQFPQTKRIVPVAYSSASTSNEWHNLRAEAWGKIRDYLEDGNLPQGMDNDLISDFCNIRYFYDSNGKIQMESKKSLVQRGFRSSDIADSLGINLIVDDKDVKVEKPHALRLRNEPTDWMSI